MADNGTKQVRPKTKAEISAEAQEANRLFNEDTNNWLTVEIPEEDIFGAKHEGVNINLEHYAPGKHFLPPDLANEIRRIIAGKMKADIRVLQPKVDTKMQEIMRRNGRAPATGSTGTALVPYTQAELNG